MLTLILQRIRCNLQFFGWCAIENNTHSLSIENNVSLQPFNALSEYKTHKPKNLQQETLSKREPQNGGQY